MKNVLILTGSARANGNSELMADAFAQGAEKAGHKVSKFRTATKNIKGCFACDKCWTKERACAINDDFKELQPLLEAADVIVFATPLYWFNMSAHLKAAIDKLYAYTSKGKSLNLKESVFLTCGEDSDLKSFDGAILTYKNISAYLNLKDRGIIVVPGVYAKGDIKKTNYLNEIKKLGTNI